MKINETFVESCEALAQNFEASGRVDLAALCDRAAYWLNGGNGIELVALQEIVSSCRDTLQQAFTSEGSVKSFIINTTDEILSSLRDIETDVTVASKQETNPEVLMDRAAKLQALSIIASGLFK